MVSFDAYMMKAGRIGLAKQAAVVAATLCLMLICSHNSANADQAKTQTIKSSAGNKVLAVTKKPTPATKALPAETAPVEIKVANGKPSILEFGAPWCVPCKVFAPIFKKVKDNFATQADFFTYDTENPDGEKIANKFNISGVPAIIILDSNGKVIFRKAGIMDEKSLTAEVTKALGK